MAMGVAPSCLLGLLLLLLLVLDVQSSPMSPSFIWSNRRFSYPEQHRVDYRISSPQSVAAAALDQFTFARKQCSDSSQDCAQVLVTFIGSEVRSVDLSSELASDAVNVLKNVVSGSNFSLAFPYVSATGGNVVSNELLRALEEEDSLAAESITFGCRGANSLFSTLDDIEEHITSKKVADADAKVLLVCLSPSQEDSTMTHVLTKLEAADIGYIALYASEPLVGGEYASKRRFLASMNDTSAGNGSSSTATNGTAPYCDSVCKTKATLLESIFVTIVLLIILISGLCCMMGIQTPLRFEKPHEG